MGCYSFWASKLEKGFEKTLQFAVFFHASALNKCIEIVYNKNAPESNLLSEALLFYKSMLSNAVCERYAAEQDYRAQISV